MDHRQRPRRRRERPPEERRRGRGHARGQRGLPRASAQGRSDRLKKTARLAPAAFRALAEAELAAVPKPLRDLLVNVSIETKDAPGLEAQDLEEPGEILGLYSGATRAEMLSNDAHGSLPAKVYLYQRNMEDASKNAAELRRELRLTLRHELAHHFGFDDEDLERVWPEGA